jgi:DNA repair protein RecO (recombination protein O)
VDAADLSDGFALTGLFLLRHVFEPRGIALPAARSSFINAVLHAYRNGRTA